MSTREELTRQAEKCLRQGRVDDALSHYQALADMAPIDWGLVKQLADLLERAGQREGAAAQFCRWADHLFAEGFHSKAAALYKKILKLEPAHEHAAWQLAEVSLELKLRADARVAFQRVIELRQRRHDNAGIAAAQARLADLDPSPVANPATPTPPLVTAAPVIAALVTPLPVAAPAASVRESVVDQAPEPPLATAAPAPPIAVSPAPAPVAEPPAPSAAVESPPETRDARLARLRRDAECADAESAADADERWSAVLAADPHDVATRLRLVQAAVDRGDLDQAERLSLTLDPAEDPALVALIDLAYRRGCLEALDRLVGARVHAGAPPSHVLAPVVELAVSQPCAARAALSAAVNAWCDAHQPGHAARALALADTHGVLTTTLHLQWVEICVDAGLPDLSRAQYALARAYLAEDRGGEARAVAEDLLVREEGQEPFRTLLLDILDRQGIADPHRLVLDLLSPPSETDVPEDVAAEVYARASEAEPPGHALEGWLADSSSSPVTATVARVTSPPRFDWADLLGRDLEGAAQGTIAVPVLLPEDDADESPADAPVRWTRAGVDDGPVVGADVPIASSAPADHELFRAVGELQPRVDSDAPSMPTSFSMPSSWGARESVPAIAGGTGDHHADASLVDSLWPAAVESEVPATAAPEPPNASSHAEEDAALGEDEAAESEALTIDEEVDLTQLLEELRQWDTVLPEPVRRRPEPEATPDSEAGAPRPVATSPDGTAAGQHGAPDDGGPGRSKGTVDLDALFADVQRGADGRTIAEQQLAAGRVFLAAGLTAEAAGAFERASLELRTRFEAALALAELHRSRRQLHEAVSWYEQAAMAPVPDAALKRAVLYDLAESLEALGETDRALGVLLDLLSQVEDYRDARARLDHLLRVDAGG